jgi:chemotaxis signal transduction protein
VSHPLPVLDDCYRTIGVRGDRSCAKLAEVVHCHSCEVLTSAAQRLLHRAPSEAYVAELTALLARPPEISRAADRSVVLFSIGEEHLAVLTREVAEVAVAPQAPRRVPHRSSAAFAGLLNLHGQLELCFWLGPLLGAPRATERARWYALVLAFGGQRWVVLADHIEGVYRTDARGLLPPPPSSLRKDGALISGLIESQGKLWSLIDVERLCARLAEPLSGAFGGGALAGEEIA